VYALGLPYGWTYNAAEQATDASGWATITIHPPPNMPLRRTALVMFVRARKPGDNLLAGVSTRRLVQVRIRWASRASAQGRRNNSPAPRRRSPTRHRSR
jgi:hypothetical protein